jgi:hypothetical protein
MNFDPFRNPAKQTENVYHLGYVYAVERAFDLLGFKKLGNRVWYVDMATSIVDHQDDAGFWNTDSTHKPKEVLDTCFALLFLKRATRHTIGVPEVTGGDDAAPEDSRGN